MLSGEAHGRLVKLLRLLSSPVDGEALGAVRGIERILVGAGLSFHELAETFAGKVLEVEVERVRERVVVREVERDSTGDWLDACEQLLAVAAFGDRGALSEREVEFVRDMQRRFTLRPGWEPSEKQMNWFVSIYKRCGLQPRERSG